MSTQPRSARALTPSARLRSLQQAADYLGCSYWSVRDWVSAGVLPVVELPRLRPRDGERARTTLRRVLVDVEDLDALIEARKRRGARNVQSRAPQNEAEKAGLNREGVPTVVPEVEHAAPGAQDAPDGRAAGARMNPPPAESRGSSPLQGVNTRPSCPGCGRPFTPARKNQRHCRPSCRVLAFRRRQQRSGPHHFSSARYC